GVGLAIIEDPFLAPDRHGRGDGSGGAGSRAAAETGRAGAVTDRGGEGDREGCKLRDRVPITVEPGVYLPGVGGVRIEDTLVTRGDKPELLTRTTKELLVL